VKWKAFKLKAIVLIPKAVNQIPTTCQAANKKCIIKVKVKVAQEALGHNTREEHGAVQCLKTEFSVRQGRSQLIAPTFVVPILF